MSARAIGVCVMISSEEEVMKLALVDTNILSLFFRNQPLVVENFNAYIKEYGKSNIIVLIYYKFD
ncbi:hypothetical protein [Tolypothrix sp. VBCCA 56010]|uniref:hypothetical protein n=1 Tax=Tolypothrix sp. VBCCA 56010 TaxID=3137731 RepID=UPI003D7E8DBB